MVWPDRRPKPAMWEHKRLAAPVRIGGAADDVVAGRIDVANHQHFSDLGWLRARYSLTVDGVEIAGGAFDLPAIGPGEHASVALPGWVTPDPDGGEAFLTVRVTTAEEQAWAPAGFEVCAVQLQVERTAGPALAPAEPAADGAVDIDADGRLRPPAARDAARARRSGAPRPTTTGSAGSPRAGRARASTASSVARARSSATARRPRVRDDATARARLEIAHEATVHAAAPTAPSTSTETVDIPDALADLAAGRDGHRGRGRTRRPSTGSGPVRTRRIRIGSGRARRPLESTVADQYVPYIRPQENGGHADVRWLELRDAGGAGLRIDLDQPRQVSVTHHRAQDLATATHDIDLVAVPRDDRPSSMPRTAGSGTASCGPDTLPEYLARRRHGTRWALDPRDLAAA